MTDPNIVEQLRKILTVEQLPALPHSALTVLQLDNDITQVNINDLVRPIEADPGLAAQVLKFLNSSYFGFQSAISNVKQGIALVGIRIVKNFVLWKAVFSLIPKSKSGNFDVTLLWQDSLRRAMFARFTLMELKKGDPELAFAGALLQDMGIPLLLKQKPEEYGALFAKLEEANGTLRLSDLEESLFGWTHADAAGVLGRNWKLPEPLVVLLDGHLKIDEHAVNWQDKPEQFVVAVSSLLPMGVCEQWADKERFITMSRMLLGDDLRGLGEIFSRIDKGFDEYAAIIQIAKPKQSLASFIGT